MKAEYIRDKLFVSLHILMSKVEYIKVHIWSDQYKSSSKRFVRKHSKVSSLRLESRQEISNLQDVGKGCSTMDKRVMIVKFLLVAVYIISGCDCDMLSLDKAMCPDYGKAVILIAVRYGVTLKDNPNIPDIILHSLVVYGVVERVERSDANGNKIYTCLHEVTYKEGLYPLNISNVRITMRFPSSGMYCGHTFPEHSDGYIIAGSVGSDGILYSDMCQYAQLSREVFADEDNADLLYGRRKPSCGRGDS